MTGLCDQLSYKRKKEEKDNKERFLKSLRRNRPAVTAYSLATKELR